MQTWGMVGVWMMRKPPRDWEGEPGGAGPAASPEQNLPSFPGSPYLLELKFRGKSPCHSLDEAGEGERASTIPGIKEQWKVRVSRAGSLLQPHPPSTATHPSHLLAEECLPVGPYKVPHQALSDHIAGNAIDGGGGILPADLAGVQGVL